MKMNNRDRKVSSGGFVNEAFAEDDDDVERRISYAKWMNQNQGESSVDYVELSFHRDSANFVNELDKVLGRKKKKDSKNVNSKQNNEENLYKRPNGTISRSAMLKKISRKSREGSLGEVCKDKACPYNKWLYSSDKFPSTEKVEKWERKVHSKSELRLNPKTLPEVPKRVSSRPKSPYSGFRSPSFSYIRNPSSPLTSTPPVPWTMYSSSPLSSSYPIITLPRSLRKSDKKRSSILGGVFGSRHDLNTSASVINPRPASASSRSSSCSTCSSCSCSTSEESEALNETHNPMVSSLSKNPFLKAPPARRSRLTPPCDLTCYIITAFTVLCLAGVFAAFLYVYITNLDTETDHDSGSLIPSAGST